MEKPILNARAWRVVWLLLIVLVVGCSNDSPADGEQMDTNLQLFIQSLNAQQRLVMDSHPCFATYLKEQHYSLQSRDFVLDLIGVVVHYGGNFTFDGGVNANHALVFWEVGQFAYFLGHINQNAVDFGLTENHTQRTSKFKVALLGFFGGIETGVRQNKIPFAFAGITAEKYGFTPAFNWEETTTTHRLNGRVLTVQVRGKISYRCVLKGKGMVWTAPKNYRIKIHKNTGAVLSALPLG